MKLNTIQITELISNYFSYLNHNEIKQFLQICAYEVHKNKATIIEKGGFDKNLFLILKGSSRAYFINENGEELNCHLRSEGYIFGDPRAFSDEPQMLTIDAIGTVHLLKFNIEELEALGYKNPLIMTFYLNLLKEVIVTFSHRISTFITMNSKERYLDLIKWNPAYLESTFDKHISSFLGIKPITLHRIKKSL